MNIPPAIGLSMIDFDTKKSVLSASAIMVVILFLCILWKVLAIILLVCFLLVGVFTAISIFSSKKKNKEDDLIAKDIGKRN
jgi:hypothetical protein